nr:MAG TPA: chromosome partitioning protein [Caudoviricetes sp.]
MVKKFITYKNVKKEKYLVDEEGNIFNEAGRTISTREDKNGYIVVNLYNEEGKQQTYKVHRLVATEFCENDNPELKTQINHKDENKQNNYYKNLEWVTPAYNINYGLRTEKAISNRKKPIIVRNVNTNDVIKFESLNSASRVLGLDEARLSDILNNKRKTTNGYEVWYAESPVYNVIPVPIDKIVANDYNPNKVATKEMELLYTSIKEDKYTMPIVCYYDEDIDKYIIVDGFHRYRVCKEHKDIYEREHGCLPVSVIEKDLNDRMASTIRHNRARGKHEVELQANLVAMLKAGWSETKIMEELGMTLEEVQRLLGLTGIFSEIKGVPYSIEKQIVEAGEDEKDEDSDLW